MKDRIMRSLGWIANAFLVAGAWTVGNRLAIGFLFTLIGEALWTIRAATIRQWDMLAIAIVFGLLALRNFLAWTF